MRTLEPEEELFVIRPQRLDDFIGQRILKENLKVFIEAAQTRQEPMDHIILHGPPGLGKTTLAQIIAKECNVNFKATSGPAITKSGDLAALLTNLQPRDVLFIDEIHRLSIQVEELLYSAMEDFKLDIMIGEGPSARSIRLDILPFTLIGATTRMGLLTNPLRDRFGIPLRLDFYALDDLKTIVQRACRVFNIAIEDNGSDEIARRSRGTPRIAGRLLRRIRDFATVQKLEKITHASAIEALNQLEVNAIGLDMLDVRYLKIIADFYSGGPVGIDTLAASLSEQRGTVEDMIEPYLIQQGFIKKTARGRMLTNLGYDCLK